MARGTKITTEQKEAAIELRLKDRLSLNEIVQRLRVSQSSLSSILANYPLTDKEKADKHIGMISAAKRRKRMAQPYMQESALYKQVRGNKIS